ncbi:MAG: alpha/beta fold hydrolase [Chromatiaceae bacterium]|nr:alpha/beta fold hydrolase [Chromatiaceae bacterium]MCP5423069.1 alpha/beta fold hydrolase [Chromatiaceae bacterium]
MKLFIHGLGSCGWGAKSLAMRRHFGVANLLAPDLPFTPTNAIARLKDLVTRYPVSTLIGSSLGGFYATAINREFGLPAILINPVVYPHRLLADYRGEQRRWCDDAPFRINDDYVRALAGLQRDELGDDERYLVLLQRGDEVLDYRQAADYYAGKDVVILAGGSHRFDDIERVLPTIDTWLEQTP